MYLEDREILVVINDCERRERVARILRHEGFAVTEAAEGLAALRAIGSRRYALVIASRLLPGSLDGPATVRQARARQPWLKALYLDDHTGCCVGENPDADDVIVTPFEPHELIGCTFELLQRGTVESHGLVRRARLRQRAS